jgi:hypothetical protein
MSSNNTINNLNSHGRSAENLYSPTELQLYLIYKQILPWRCVTWGPNNTQGVSFIVFLSMATLAHRHKTSPAMLRATTKVVFYIYSYCDLHSHINMLYFCQWITGGSMILRNTGTHLTRKNTVSWPRTLQYELPWSAIKGKTPNTWDEMVHTSGWGNSSATWEGWHLLSRETEHGHHCSGQQHIFLTPAW